MLEVDDEVVLVPADELVLVSDEPVEFEFELEFELELVEDEVG